jgi:hypothetical protein
MQSSLKDSPMNDFEDAYCMPLQRLSNARSAMCSI